MERGKEDLPWMLRRPIFHNLAWGGVGSELQPLPSTTLSLPPSSHFPRLCPLLPAVRVSLGWCISMPCLWIIFAETMPPEGVRSEACRMYHSWALHVRWTKTGWRVGITVWMAMRDQLRETIVICRSAYETTPPPPRLSKSVFQVDILDTLEGQNDVVLAKVLHRWGIELLKVLAGCWGYWLAYSDSESDAGVLNLGPTHCGVSSRGRDQWG